MIKSRRGKKGFTLVELVLVVMISAIFITATVKWVFAVSSVIGSNLRASTLSQVTLAVDKLEDDIRKSRSCLSSGNDSKLRGISTSPYTINFYSSSTFSNATKLISWRIYNGNLQRASKSLTSCSLTSPIVESDYVTMASNIDSNNSYIATLNSSTGLPQTDSLSYPSSCSMIGDAGCNINNFFIHLIVTTNPITYYDRTFGFVN